ncbi:MAG: pyridoxal phosphate-dependent aminotransferase [Chloroflexi bacterium]|nr:pyridoxal phosphate-dependent aminotransferase [Chloroflexota bacterium]
MREPSALIKKLLSSERAGASKPPGPGVIQMHTGDPDFPTPRYIAEAILDACEQGHTHYGTLQGDPELRAVIADQLSKRSGSTWTAADVLITTGGSGAIFAAMYAYLDPGDQILIPDPNFSLYADVATMIGAEATYVPQAADLHLDLDRLRAAAGPHAKMVVLCNPNNPTGVVLSRREVEELAAWCVERDLWILADEAYDYLIYDGREHVSVLDLPGIEDRILFCQTFSKTFAMTGLRLGYLAAKNGAAATAFAAHRAATTVANTAVQRAGLVALTTPSDEPARMLEEYAYRREMLDEILKSADGLSWRKPEGTFYAFIKYESALSSKEMTAFLRERGVALRSGTEFGPGGEGYVRLSFATSREDIREGARRLAAAAAEAGRLYPKP